MCVQRGRKEGEEVEGEENSLVTVPIMRNEGWFVQRSDIEIRWNPIFIITQAQAKHGIVPQTAIVAPL